MRALPLCLCLAFVPFFVACVQIKQDALQDTPSPSPSPDSSAKRVYDPDDTVEIVIHHPGANQKNIYYKYHRLSAEHGDKGARQGFDDDEGRTLAQADSLALEALLEATTSDLLESDAFYGCRSVDNGRQIRIRWTKKDASGAKHKCSITTASNCLDFAPFNVVIDGKRYVQLNGKTGRALRAFFERDEKFQAQTKHLKAGFMDLTQPIAGDVDQTGASPSASLIGQFDALFKQDPRLTAILEARNADSSPIWDTTLELGCNQSKSAACDTLVGRYTIPLSADTHMYLSIAYADGALQADFPSDFSTIRRGFEQPAVRAFIDHTVRPVTVSWAASDTCPVLDALMPWFEDRGNTKNTNKAHASSCAAWTFTSSDKAQSLIYYPRLDATWIMDNAETVGSALAPLVSKKYLPKTTKKWITDIQKKSGSPKNIFLDGQSQIYVFETKDGKTTCTSCL